MSTVFSKGLIFQPALLSSTGLRPCFTLCRSISGCLSTDLPGSERPRPTSKTKINVCPKPNIFSYHHHQSENFLSCQIPKNASFSTSTLPDDVTCFCPKNALLLRKLTRYEYEKRISRTNTEQELKTYVTNKGSDYKGLLQRHNEYYRTLDKLQELIVKKGLNLKVVDRSEYTETHVDSADVIFTAGGDGTFLLAASKVMDNSKPVIGINSDPVRSEGYLCLPPRCSQNFDKALDKILGGQFRWLYRQRLRLGMSGKHTGESLNLHDQQLLHPEHRFYEHVREHEQYYCPNVLMEDKPGRVLPVLALNEVFIGESLAARVSFYEISMDDSPHRRQKSSGITVCTGTGSTSWFFNINHIPQQSIKDILKIAYSVSGSSSVDLCDDNLLQNITNKFNASLRFNPNDLRMAYTVRDPICNGVFYVDNPRGFCKKLSIKSRMWDAWVVIDGGMSFAFNDGAVVEIQINEDDSLRCVQLL